MRFYDIVVKAYNEATRQRDLEFPATFCCQACGGVAGVEGHPDAGRDLAAQIALVQHGYDGRFLDEPRSEPFPCLCDGMRQTVSGKMVRDVVALDKRAAFPLICVCSGCGGCSGLYTNGVTLKDPELTLRAALVQFGHVTCRSCDNIPDSRACDCARAMDRLGGTMDAIGVAEDSGWKLDERSSIPIRGIRDYDRTIQFARQLTAEELDDVREWLQRDKCPGWTGVMANNLGDGRYAFRTTWDSSD